MDKLLSKYQCGFTKGYNALRCPLAIIEKWKKAADNGNVFGALLKDLFKAFDCLPNDLIIAKLNSHGFNLTALNLIRNYLAKRKQRTKINHSYSSWEDILFGVPQGSTLSPILFKIFLSDLFLIVDEIVAKNYLALKLVQNFALMTILKIYIANLTENYENGLEQRLT